MANDDDEAALLQLIEYRPRRLLRNARRRLRRNSNRGSEDEQAANFHGLCLLWAKALSQPNQPNAGAIRYICSDLIRIPNELADANP
jgi:hypothetical protein